MHDERRQCASVVAYDAGRRVLTVGRHQRRLPRRADNRAVLQAYLELVAVQRPVPPRQRVHLRNRDVDMLAEVLDLDDVDLEAQLEDLLGLTAVEARELGVRLRAGRVRLAAAALGVGVLSLAPLSNVASSSEHTVPPPPAVLSVAEGERDATEGASSPAARTPVPDAEPAPVTEPAPALGPADTAAPSDAAPASAETPAPPPVPEGEPELGPATVIERTDEGEEYTYIESAPAPPAEDGTDVWTALVIERNPPPET